MSTITNVSTTMSTTSTGVRPQWLDNVVTRVTNSSPFRPITPPPSTVSTYRSPTPPDNYNNTHRQQQQHNRASQSAPNSPRNTIPRPALGLMDRSVHNSYSGHGGSGGNTNIRARSPSVEAMNLSTHNTTEGNRSASSVIRELKRSNAKLAERLTENETKYLSTLSKLQTQLDITKERLAETTLSLETTRQTSAFQRHEMSVLKQQLLELEKEQEEQANDCNNQNDGVSVISHQQQQQQQQQSAEVKNLQACNLQQQAKIEELEWKLKILQQDKDSQDQYRTDEVEDLRVLLDAQEQQIMKLQNELERTNEELEYMKSLHTAAITQHQQQQQQQQQSVPTKEEKEVPDEEEQPVAEAEVEVEEGEQETNSATKPPVEEDCLNTTQITIDTAQEDDDDDESEEETHPVIERKRTDEPQPSIQNKNLDRGDYLYQREMAALLAAQQFPTSKTCTFEKSSSISLDEEYDLTDYIYRKEAAALLAHQHLGSVVHPHSNDASSSENESKSIGDGGDDNSVHQSEAVRLAHQLQEQIRQGQRVMEQLQQRQEDLLERERELGERQKLNNSLSFKYIVDTPGKLGLVLQANIVHGIKSSSPLLGLVQVGDKIIEVDGKNTRGSTLSEVVQLLSQPNRGRIVLERTGEVYA